MRYTIFHCHNPACSHRIWVPISQLGMRGKCPECGTVLTIPADVPPEQFFPGPDILQEVDEDVEVVGIS